MFNPAPRLQRWPLDDGTAAWVVDDVLVDPRALVERAVRERERFVAAPHNAYPGLEWRMGADVAEPLADFFAQHLRSRLGARRTKGHYSRLSIATLAPNDLRPLQRLAHRDRFGTAPDETVAACTIYLFDDAALGGTSFYAPRVPVEQIDRCFERWNRLDDETFTREIGAEPAYLTAGNAWFDLVGSVPAAFNRAVFYDGGRFHSSHIERPDLLSADPVRGRLTLNGFFICRRNAA